MLQVLAVVDLQELQSAVVLHADIQMQIHHIVVITLLNELIIKLIVYLKVWQISDSCKTVEHF